jgi:NAD-dependent deacetylase sirtuin 4
VWRLITQNVDRLHHAAGSAQVLELHGTTHEVVCCNPGCGALTPRKEFQEKLSKLNPRFADAVGDGPSDVRPDGDFELGSDSMQREFSVPKCAACGGGPLKPRVVFFGDSVETETHALATEYSDETDAVLIVGSSVSTFSAYRLVRDAHRRGVPVAILTAGTTRADALAALRVPRLAGEAVPRAFERVKTRETRGERVRGE